MKYPTLEKVVSELIEPDWASLLAHHRFLYLAYQNLHWTSQGHAFYADHLLFQRLYEKLGEESDLIAERAVGLGLSNEVVGLQHLAPLCAAPMALETVVEMERTLSIALSDFEAKADSLGAKDLLATLASSREEDIYLLGQRVK